MKRRTYLEYGGLGAGAVLGGGAIQAFFPSENEEAATASLERDITRDTSYTPRHIYLNTDVGGLVDGFPVERVSLVAVLEELGAGTAEYATPARMLDEHPGLSKVLYHGLETGIAHARRIADDPHTVGAEVSGGTGFGAPVNRLAVNYSTGRAQELVDGLAYERALSEIEDDALFP